MTNSMVEKECEERLMLIDFLSKVLNMNPLERLTPQEALKHPFIKSLNTNPSTPNISHSRTPDSSWNPRNQPNDV